jgi:hypothetical protein
MSSASDNHDRELGMPSPSLLQVTRHPACWVISPRLQGTVGSEHRLHDVFLMASLALRLERAASVRTAKKAKNAPAGDSEAHPPPFFASFATSQAVPFAVLLPSAGTRARLRQLCVALGPDDDGTPCVTIGFPEDF